MYIYICIHISIVGLEQQLKDKKEKSSSFYKKKLEMKKAAREKELIANGSSKGEAKIQAQEEMVHALAVQEDVLQKQLNKVSHYCVTYRSFILNHYYNSLLYHYG
jgi:hypothetical protein